jgi:hypothetical protein
VFPRLVTIAPRALGVVVALTLSALSACSSYDAPAGPTEPVVTPPQPTPSVVDLAYCRGGEPAWLAYQDGDGAWTRVLPSTSGALTTFRLAFTQSRGAVARVALLPGGLTTLSILYGLPSELRIVSDTAFQQCSGEALRTVSGTVAGLGVDDVALLSSGNSVRDLVFPEAGNGFQLRGLLAGPQEILATRGRPTADRASITAMILRRSPALPDGATLPAFDFNSVEAFQPVLHNVTFAGIGNAAVIAYTGLRTAHSNNVVTFFPAGGVNATSSFYTIPESRLEQGEVQSVAATSAPVGNVVRSAAAYFRSPADLTLNFGVVPIAPVLSTIATAPTVRLHANFVVQDDYDRFASINFQQGANTVVSLSMTEPYAGVGKNYDLAIPDLSAVPGFDSRWALHTGTQVLWNSARIGGTLAWYYYAIPYDGDDSRVATDAGSFTP